MNDAAHAADGGRRVPADVTVATFGAIASRMQEMGLPLLVVGPPPVADAVVTGRVEALDALLSAQARRLDVPYVSVVGDLLDRPEWLAEVRAGDGAHPGSTGYALLADLVRPRWEAWLAGLDDDGLART